MDPNIPQTPSRYDRLQSTQSNHHPSPALPRTTTSILPHMQQSTSTSSTTKPTAAPITLAALLEQHASAPNPHLAALDQALAERNALSSQNSQLWKLIEKQRSGYNQMLKELERVRAERDSLRGRIGSGGSRQRSIKSSTLNSTVPLSNGDTKPAPARHLSDDVCMRHHHIYLITYILTTATVPAPRSEQYDQSKLNHSHRPAPPTLVPSRAEPLPSCTPSSPVSSVAHSLETPLPSSIPSLVFNPHSSPSQSSGGYPPRQSSMPTVSSTSTPPQSDNSAANSGAYLSSNSTETLPPPSTLVSPPHLNLQTAAYSPITQAALAPHQIAASTLSPVVETPKVIAAIARDSRISLPDEAKRYIANMGESPNVSPQIAGFQGQDQGQTGPASSSADLSLTQSQPNPQVQSQIQSSDTSESEFLDIEEADVDDDDDNEDDEVETNLPRPPQPQVRVTALLPVRPLSVSPPKANDQGPKAGVEDFPLPPSLIPGAGHAQPPIQPQSPHLQQVYTQIQAQSQSQVQAQSRSLTKEQAQGYAQAPARAAQAFEQQQQQQTFEQQQLRQAFEQQPQQAFQHQQPQQEQGPQRPKDETYSHIHAGSEIHSSPYLSSPSIPTAQASSTSLINSTQSLSSLGGSGTTTTSPAFRALPLISTDLPTTRITVTNSTIRPNDRGKEVLNFIIQVDAGHGKDPWQVEKLYSDVLGLDSRIRASVGKGVGKKIASLPEGKLWRDHAPAKVDQRKVSPPKLFLNMSY